MENLLEIIEKNGNLEADSREVARVLGVEHRSVIRLMSTYSNEMEYSDVKSDNSEGPGRPEKWIMMTDRQCMLLITLVRNTPEALIAKKALVDAFMSMRDFIENKLRHIADDQGAEIRYLEIKRHPGAVGAGREYFGVAEYFQFYGLDMNYSNYHHAYAFARKTAEEMDVRWQVIYSPKYGETDGFHKDVLSKVLEHAKAQGWTIEIKKEGK